MNFFEQAIQLRFPRNRNEGVLKAFMLAGIILGAFDLLYPIQNSSTEQVFFSRKIIIGYLFFVAIGVLAGLAGEIYLPQEEQHQRLRNR